MAKTINNTTARDIGQVFDVAYLTDLNAVENTLSTRMDSLESSIQTDEADIADLRTSIEADEQRLEALESFQADAMTSLDAHETSIADNTNNIASITTALGAAYADGQMVFDESTFPNLTTASTVSDAFQIIDQFMTNASYSMGDTTTQLWELIDNLGSFYHDPGWGGGGHASWDFTTPETHYLSALTGEGEYEYTLTDALVALDTAIYNAGTAGAVTLSARATAETGYATTYDLHQGGVLKGSINIPKDFLVKSATLETVATADVPYAGAKVGDKYIDFVINAKDASATAEHIYLPVNDLVDVYTAQPNATQVQLAIDANNVISATIVAGSVGTTELANGAVTTAKIADRAVNSDKIGLIDTVTSQLYTIQVASGRLQLAEVGA